MCYGGCDCDRCNRDYDEEEKSYDKVVNKTKV